MTELLQKLLRGENLSFDEAREMILWIMSEEAVPVKAAALLALLQAKGTIPDEMAGAASAMRERAMKIRAPENVIDTCSTGGNGISTFNISTCAAIIAAAAGAVVAKHGNRSNTRKSGSAEVLEMLGVNIGMGVEGVQQCLDELGLCFCYAVNHHPAMRFAGPIRRELGVPTVFNLLGPLTNPAGAKRQLIGVPNQALTRTIAEVLKRLGSKQVLVVHGEDGLCELTMSGTTFVAELRDGEIREYTVTPEELGLERGDLDAIRITEAEESAATIRGILAGTEQGPARTIALMNTAGALVVSGVVDDLKTGVTLATEAIDSGNAQTKLDALVEFTQQAA
ncbi:MAG: anthranilate phosphoribosyltransferase [SAR324 cluster bacterium]|nr:anthranilate phosphoribosyltransferase [SAR324 cluster bacterium]|tara:strand:+ start:6386 stop:7399 length:1014 start_codon:yes stop_codon:yes gene_type:complete